MADATPRSIALNERIDTLDLLRGVAICGILLMNIPSMGGLFHVGRPPYPAHWDIDWIAFGTQRFLFEGSMRGLFTLLFGSGMLVMLRRAERDGSVAPMDVFLRRCVALMFLGIVQFLVFLWPGEILFTYGLTGFFILPFRKARPAKLLGVALAAFLVMAAFEASLALDSRDQHVAAARAEQHLAAHQPPGKDEQKALDAINERRAMRAPSADAIASEVKQRTHFPAVVAWSWSNWAKFNLGSDGWFTVGESFIFMLIGMALFRMGVLTSERSMGFYLGLAAAGYGIGVPIRAVTNLLQWKLQLGYDFPTSMLATLDYEPGRLLVTLGHVGLICALFKAGALGRAWPARALGRMALTSYSLQSILFYGFGLLNRFQFAGLMGIAIGIWIVTGLFAVLWLRTHDQGPAERILRALAYGRRAGGPRALAGPDGTLATA